jgi:hypothetical protein
MEDDAIAEASGELMIYLMCASCFRSGVGLSPRLGEGYSAALANTRGIRALILALGFVTRDATPQSWARTLRPRSPRWLRCHRLGLFGEGASEHDTDRVAAPQGACYQASYQRSGSLLASGCGQVVLALWKPSKRTMPGATGSLPGSISDISWSPDGGFLAVTAEDGSLAIYSCP